MIVTLPYPPSANRYLRHTGRTYRTKEAESYRALAGYMAKQSGTTVIRGPVEVVVTLHPKLTAKGKASGTCLDLDNCIKVAIDALQGIAFENDRQVKRIVMAYGEAVKDGGLTLAVNEVSQ